MRSEGYPGGGAGAKRVPAVPSPKTRGPTCELGEMMRNSLGTRRRPWEPLGSPWSGRNPETAGKLFTLFCWNLI